MNLVISIRGNLCKTRLVHYPGNTMYFSETNPAFTFLKVHAAKKSVWEKYTLKNNNRKSLRVLFWKLNWRVLFFSCVSSDERKSRTLQNKMCQKQKNLQNSFTKMQPPCSSGSVCLLVPSLSEVRKTMSKLDSSFQTVTNVSRSERWEKLFFETQMTNRA